VDFRDGYRAGELTNFKIPPEVWSGSAPILLFRYIRNRPARKPTALNVTAKETQEMNPVALLTPTYGRDLELCTLLCESVDRHVAAFSKHYLLVPDCDLSSFCRFESERRSVLPASRFLPKWLRPLPRFVQRNRRQYWWSFRARPVSGWHVQQFLKIAAAIALPHPRYCILDSDVVFFRDFDLSRFEYPNSIPLLNIPDEVTSSHLRHSHWVETTHRLLGLRAPGLPASDFIGHIIFWDQQTVAAMVSKIEAVSGLDWIEALCRTQEFSEYMLYGYFAQSDARFAGRHNLTSSTPCVSYWDSPSLGQGELNQLLRGADQHDVAFSVASFSGTPVEIIRAAIEQNAAHSAPLIRPAQEAGLAALC
jgi:hypothetical protein